MLGRPRARIRVGNAIRALRSPGHDHDLASVLLGGPSGHELRGEAFKRARAYVADVFGELDKKPKHAGDLPAR